MSELSELEREIELEFEEPEKQGIDQNELELEIEEPEKQGIDQNELELEIEEPEKQGIDQNELELEIEEPEEQEFELRMDNDDKVEEFANKFYELSTRTFESEVQMDNAVDSMLNEMEQEFFFKK